MSDKKPRLVTGKGELHYVTYNGSGKENFNEDGFEYVADIRLTGEAAEKAIAEIDAIIDKECPEGYTVTSCGYKEMVQEKGKPDTARVPTKKKGKQANEEGTGIYNFHFKTNVEFTGKDGKVFQSKINVYNAYNKIISLGDKRIGNGSLGHLSGTVGTYSDKKKEEFSIGLYLKGIQLKKFIEYTGDDGFEDDEDDDDGFEGVEDNETGFVAQDEDATADAPVEKVKPKL